MAELGLQPRGTTDWLDALVSLGMLERSGDEYANTPGTALFLDRNALLRRRHAGDGQRPPLPVLGSLTEALRTGHPQNEAESARTSSAPSTGSRPAPAIPALHDRPQHGHRGGHRREDPVESL